MVSGLVGRREKGKGEISNRQAT